MYFDINKNSNKLLILLILTDVIFVLAHILYSLNLVSNPLFSIERDFGYAEAYQYIKEYWIVLLLGLIIIQKKHLIYLAWNSLFFYILIDDFLQIHERLGKFLSDNYHLQHKLGLRAQDFGEIIVLLFFGTILFLFIGLTYLRSNPVAKKISKNLFILILFAAFFGIFVDILHVITPWGKSILGLIEDGGEMIIISIIVTYLFHLTEKKEAL